MTFGEKVKAERTKLGMSQDELAAKIGVTRRIIGSGVACRSYRSVCRRRNG